MFLKPILSPRPGMESVDDYNDYDISDLQHVGADGPVFMKQRPAVPVDDADDHWPGVQINAAIVRMLLGVVSHLVLLF